MITFVSDGLIGNRDEAGESGWDLLPSGVISVYDVVCVKCLSLPGIQAF